MRGEPKIIIANDLAIFLQLGADLAVMLPSGFGHWREGDELSKRLNAAQGAFAHLSFFRAKAQLAERDYGHRQFAGGMAGKAFADLGWIVFGNIEQILVSSR